MTTSHRRSWISTLFGRRSIRAVSPKARDRALFVTVLEDRTVPRANIFLDFGESFGSQLFTTVTELRNTFANGGLQGPDFENVQIKINGVVQTVQSTDNLFFKPFDSTPVDYNGNGTADSTDIALLKADVQTQIQRYYAPFDVDVTVAKNSSVSGIRATMTANNTDPSKKYDAYVIVGNCYYLPPLSSTGWALSNRYDSKSGTNSFIVYGQSPTVDLGYAQNKRDDTVVVFPEVIYNTYGAGNAAKVLALTSAHESGHAFGLVHTARDTSDNVLLSGSEIIGVGAPDSGIRYDNFFTRYQLPKAESSGYYAPYLQLVNDADLGAKAGYPAFVSGTGAHDVVTLDASGSNVVVTVIPYRDAAHTVQAGGSNGYTLTAPSSVVVELGQGDDSLTVNSGVTAAVTVHGGSGVDSVYVKTGAATGASFSASTTYVDVAGAGRITFGDGVTGEQPEWVNLLGGTKDDTVVIDSPNQTTAILFDGGFGGNDVLHIHGGTGYAVYSNYVSTSVGGVPYAPTQAVFYNEQSVDNIYMVGADSTLTNYNDTCAVNYQGNLTTVMFFGNSKGDFDQLSLGGATRYDVFDGYITPYSSGIARKSVYYDKTTVERVNLYGTAGVADVVNVLQPNPHTSMAFEGGGDNETSNVDTLNIYTSTDPSYAAQEYGVFGNYLNGAYIGGFVRPKIGANYQEWIYYQKSVENVYMLGAANFSETTYVYANAFNTYTDINFFGNTGGTDILFLSPPSGATVTTESQYSSTHRQYQLGATVYKPIWFSGLENTP